MHLRRLHRLAALPLALVACRSAPSETVPAPEGTVEARLERLSADVAALRALVTQGVLATSTLGNEIDAQLEGIRTRIDARSESTAKEWLESRGAAEAAALLSGLPIEAAGAQEAGTQVRAATHRADDPGGVPGDAAAAIRRVAGDQDAVRVLSEALVVLREQRAVLCENVANASVARYRRREPTAFTMILEEGGPRIPRLRGITKDMTRGRLDATGHPLDLAISGPGFFELELPDGERRYSRGGRFRVGYDGRLCNEWGFPLAADVTIPEGTTSILIGADGQVFATGPGKTVEVCGHVILHRFPRPDELREEVDGSYSPTIAAGQPMESRTGSFGMGRIRQGVVERSNVDLTDEVVRIQLVDRQIAAVRTLLAGYGIEAP